jgi:hypothetical protein
MAIDVRCPECGSVLKAPEQAAGKKAKCKKCGTSFRVPGGSVPMATPAGDLESVGGLSVADSTSLKTIDPASIPTGDPFAFDAGAAPAGDDADTPVVPKAARASSGSKSKHKYRTAAGGDKPAGGGGGGTKKFILLGGLAVACAVGGGAAVFFAVGGSKPASSSEKAAVDKPAEKPPEPVKPKAGKGKDAEADKLKGGNEAAAANRDTVNIPAVVAAKTAPPGAMRKTGNAKANDRSVTVTGGLEFPAAAPAKFALVQKPKFKVPVEADITKVRRLLASGGEANIVGIVTTGFAGFQGKGAKDILERYSLASGKLIDKFEFEADGVKWPRAADLSLDGDKLASEGPAKKVTVWDIGGKTKLLDGLDPYADAKGDKPGIAGLFFPDDGHVAVVATNGSVDVFDLKSKERLAQGEAVVKSEPIDARSVGITPDRKAILVVAEGTVYEVPLATCKPKAGMTLPRGAAGSYAIAADPSGSRVAVAYIGKEPAPHTLVAVGRLNDPKPPTLFFMATGCGTPTHLGFPAQETLVVAFANPDNAAVFDLEANKLIGVVMPTAKVAAQLPGQSNGVHTALTTSDVKDPKKTALVVVPFPHDAYLELRDAADKAAVALVLTPDGLSK